MPPNSGFSSIIGYIISYFTFLPVIWHHNKTRKIDPDKLSPESRLWWLLWRKCLCFPYLDIVRC